MVETYTNLKHMIQQEVEKCYVDLIEGAKIMSKNQDYAIDMVNDAIVYFLELPQEKQLKIYEDGGIKAYLHTIIKTQYNSSESQAHRHYREDQLLNIDHNYETTEIMDEDIWELDDETDDLREIVIAMNAYCSQYQKNLIVDRVIAGDTFATIANKYNLPLDKITKDYYNTIELIKKHVL